MLKKDNSVCIHFRNIQSLAIELYKVKHTTSNSLILVIFPHRSIDYNLRTQTDFIKPSTNTTKYGHEIKSSSTVEIFKNKIRKWWPTDCDCHICRTYISKIGYVTLCIKLLHLTNWRLTLGNSLGGSTLAVEGRAGWVSSTQLGIGHSEVVCSGSALARVLIVSVGPSVWQGSES